MYKYMYIYIYTLRSVHLGLMLFWNGHAWKHLETLDVKPLGIWGVLDSDSKRPGRHLCRQPSTQCSAQPHDFNRTAQHCRTEDGGSGAQKGKTGKGPKRRSVECPTWLIQPTGVSQFNPPVIRCLCNFFKYVQVLFLAGANNSLLDSRIGVA